MASSLIHIVVHNKMLTTIVYNKLLVDQLFGSQWQIQGVEGGHTQTKIISGYSNRAVS